MFSTNIESLQQLDFLQLPKLTKVYGSLTISGSKSISNRALLLSSVCEGTTIIHDILHSDDTKVMLDALQILGVGIKTEEKFDNISNKIYIHSTGNYSVKQAKLFMGNAGTAMRPLTAMLACCGGDYILSGVKRMHERPIGDLVEGLTQLGANITYLDKYSYPPIHIGIPNINLDKAIIIKGNTSSQFLSSLLMALPTIYSNKDKIIEIDGELISKPYVDLTIKVMYAFGVKVIVNQDKNNLNFVIPAASKYISPNNFYVEGDASSASYHIAAGVLAGEITIDNLGSNSIQGDIAFIDALKLMGANITISNNNITAYKSNLYGAFIDCINIPDAAMTLAIVALFAKGDTTLYNIASWKVKETDRILAMQQELQKLGAKVEVSDNHIKINPPQKMLQPLQGIDTYDDHRMAMCFALCAFSPDLQGIKINEPACIAKTYPQFFTDLFKVSS